MPNSLRNKIKHLAYKGELNERERDRILNALDREVKWISVSEKLPEKQGWYLVTDAAGGMRMTEYSFFVPQDGEMEEPYWDYTNVVAWMPLPKPYEESEVWE